MKTCHFTFSVCSRVLQFLLQSEASDVKWEEMAMKRMRASARVLLFALVAGLPAAAWSADSVRLSMASGPIGAAWYSLGSSFVQVIQKKAPGIIITLEAGAAVKNVRVIAQKPDVIGFTNLDLAYDAVQGTGEFDKKLPLQALMAGHPSHAYLITLEDMGINSVEDLRGKAVSIGPPASGAETTARMVLGAHGMTYNDIKAKWLGTQETCDTLRDKIISAGFIFSGSPVPAVMELAVTHKLKIITIRPEMVKKIQEKFPYVGLDRLPAGTYKGQTAPLDMIAWDTYLMANSQLPEDVGYKIVKALSENTQELVSHPAGAYWTLEKTAQKMIVPRHPGAERYLREKGLLK